MAQALYEGVADLASWPRYLAYRQRIEAEYDPAASQGQERRQNWVIGIPTWIADAATGRDPILGARSATTRQLAPLDRWSVLLAGGCVRGPLASCPAASAPAALGVGGAPAVIAPSSSDGPGVPVAFEHLRQAARHDLSGAISEASDAYRRFLDELAPLLDQAEHASGVGLETVLQRSAHDPIERLAQKARQRLNGLEGKADRRVVVLSVAVQDYRSPLVADLRHTADDIAVWRDFLRSRLAPPFASVARVDVLEPLIDPDNAGKIADYLRTNLADAGEHDLIIFIYSGRGFETNGRRFLTAANVEPFSVGGPNGGVAWDADGLLELGQIAAAAEGHWLLAVYDAQFTTPVFEAGRADALLDKHLDSVRPIAGNPVAQATVSVRRVPAEADFPPRQAHLLWEGRLAESTATTPECALAEGVVHSPLSGALLRALTTAWGETYVQLLDRVKEEPCLALAGGERQIMAQGDLEVPLLSSGAGAEQIVYFSSDIERQELNVRMGLAVAQEVARRFRQPLERTAEAALLVVLSEVQTRLSSRLRDEKQNVRLTRAIELLDELEHQPGNGLDTANLDLLTRALHLSGDSEGARQRLLSGTPEAMVRPEMVTRLIDLTEMALGRRPDEILDPADRQLRSLLAVDEVGRVPASLRQRWERLLTEARATYRQPYRNHAAHAVSGCVATPSSAPARRPSACHDGQRACGPPCLPALGSDTGVQKIPQRQKPSRECWPRALRRAGRPFFPASHVLRRIGRFCPDLVVLPVASRQGLELLDFVAKDRA